jgi:predicted AAA+ superfamily ATPase
MATRKMYDDLLTHLPKKEFSIITGARQTGKSTLLRQIEDHCLEREIPVVFLNLENKSVLAELNDNPLYVLKYVSDKPGRTVVLVDEVQYLDDPSNFLKFLFDEHAGQLKIIASGSSAFYMDSRFKDSLAGRKKIFRLLTCTFEEFLELSGKSNLAAEIKRLLQHPGTRSTESDYLRVEWEDYLIYGGYPAVITEPDRQEKINRLREIRDSFVKRDMLESGVLNEAAFYQLFRILAAQTGNLVNVSELSATLRIKNETVLNYLGILQKCFHISLVRPFFRNLRKELVKMPKVFLLDTGMRNCLVENFQSLSMRPDRGELWENSVFRTLADKYDFDAILYWRTTAGNEVDFVLPGINKPRAIEARFDRIRLNPLKYKIFTETYPAIPIEYVWMSPFDEDFFRRFM